MSRILSIATTVAAVAALVVPGMSSAVPEPAPPSPGTVKWGVCPADAAMPGMECGTLQVPLDYRQPTAKKIAIAISRIASKNPAKRRGVLLTNPGGPGTSRSGRPPTPSTAWAPRRSR